MSEAPSSPAVSPAAAMMGSENGATSTSAPSSRSAASTARAPKSRSCVVCRSRKVRCDKMSPCSNCRRAKIACVFPSTDRPPRWARRLEPLAVTPTTGPSISKVLDRVRDLENLVRELSGQLAQARAMTSPSGAGSSTSHSPGMSTQDRAAEHQLESLFSANTDNVQQQFGRLVLKDASRNHYVSSGFWSRVNDEACPRHTILIESH